MRYPYLICLGLSVSLFLACKKEYSKENQDIITPPPITTQPPVSTATCEYNPYATGNTFDYQYISESNDTSYYTMGVSGDTLIDGNKFAIVSDGYNKQYIRCDNGRYYSFEKGVSQTDYQRPDGIRLFLYDDKEKGATWADTATSVISGKPVVGLLQYTILEKGSTRTVLGQTYTDVIAVKQDAALLIDGTVYPLNTIATYYYAKKVGYIEVIAPTYKIAMKSASIK